MPDNIEKKFATTRQLFEHTRNIIYFNSASYGPFCDPVRKAISDNLDLRAASERDDSHDAFVTADELRGDYAALIGAKKREVGLGMNTSFGLNLAAFGLPLKRGDEVLLSDVEFPAAVYAWQGAATARGLKIKFMKSRENRFDIDAFEKSITRRTRVLSLSWVQFFNGYKNDIAALSVICKRQNIFLVVDGIQGVGVEPINVRKLGIDIFTSGCQKWLLAPQGGGFFYLADEIRDRIIPSSMSWLSVDWQMKFDDLFHFDKPLFNSAQRFEMGYYVVLNILGMKAAVKIFQDLGVSNIKRHNRVLLDRLADYIRSHSYYSITSSMTAKHRSSILTFTCKDVKELHGHLLKQKIILVRREGSIRVSVHLYNNEKDIDRMIEAMNSFARSKK